MPLDNINDLLILWAVNPPQMLNGYTSLKVNKYIRFGTLQLELWANRGTA